MLGLALVRLKLFARFSRGTQIYRLDSCNSITPSTSSIVSSGFISLVRLDRPFHSPRFPSLLRFLSLSSLSSEETRIVRSYVGTLSISSMQQISFFQITKFPKRAKLNSFNRVAHQAIWSSPEYIDFIEKANLLFPFYSIIYFYQYVLSLHVSFRFVITLLGFLIDS